MLKRNNIIKLCDEMLRKQKSNQDLMANLGRERDYKVDKLNREYDSQIESCMKVDEALKLQIEMIKKYAESMSCETVVEKVTKKKA